MKRIVWIADVPGWAYDNRARRMASAMPQYEHVIVYNIVRNLASCLIDIVKADIIVCPDPRILGFIPKRDNVIQHINAIKIF